MILFRRRSLLDQLIDTDRPVRLEAIRQRYELAARFTAEIARWPTALECILAALEGRGPVAKEPDWNDLWVTPGYVAPVPVPVVPYPTHTDFAHGPSIRVGITADEPRFTVMERLKLRAVPGAPRR